MYIKTEKEQEQDRDCTLATKLDTTSHVFVLQRFLHSTFVYRDYDVRQSSVFTDHWIRV